MKKWCTDLVEGLVAEEAQASVSEELLRLGHMLEEGGVGFPGAGTPV
ncbi:unnamed protein product [marine sediment metagenome]|uniref:Uncharacterized protein n=1 Tax=marine sediment metagenome TaxID=412755 RepID=X0WRW2_9ZZZZ